MLALVAQKKKIKPAQELKTVEDEDMKHEQETKSEDVPEFQAIGPFDPNMPHKPFFDCDKDKLARSKQDFINAQSDSKSKLMDFIRNRHVLGETKNGVTYLEQDGLIVMKRDLAETGRVVVPESL